MFAERREAMSLAFQALEQQRQELGMSCAALAQRSGVALPTVQRILAGKSPGASVANVAAIAQALGMELALQIKTTAQELREQQAQRKAEHLVGLVQGTAGLEGQAVDRESLGVMIRRTFHELLAGPNRRLWGM
jgi:transcriptional regulator with XRE-family HTH domain